MYDYFQACDRGIVCNPGDTNAQFGPHENAKDQPIEFPLDCYFATSFICYIDFQFLCPMLDRVTNLKPLDKSKINPYLKSESGRVSSSFILVSFRLILSR